LSIIVLCVVSFIFTSRAANRSAEQVDELFGRITEIWLAQPSLEVAPDFADLLFGRLGVDENQREVFLQSLQRQSNGRPAAGARTSQVEFDELIGRFWSAYRGSPAYRFGVVPSDLSPVDLVTYQFLHGGWGHLLGNLLFLYLTGPHLEQRWGRPFFVPFYLLSGAVAALFWAIRYPDLDVPLVGASGSIAGLMGAFLICFGTAKIRFFYWFVIAWGTFEAPAWLMLPLWLVMEVISGRSMDVLSQGDGGGGVAHWAHVWGFIFGTALAWAIGLLGIDGRLAAPTAVTEPVDTGTSETGPDPRPVPVRSRPVGDRHSRTGSERRVVAEPGPDDCPPRVAAVTAGATDDRRDHVAEAVDTIDVVAVENAGAALEIRPAERFRVLEAVPRVLDDRRIDFEVREGLRRIDPAKIEGVAVGAIAVPGARPFLVIDLLLDPPDDGAGDLRVIRFRSSSFDPRTVVGGARPMDAFTRIIERLVSLTGAPALPDRGVTRDPTARTYGSLAEYQGRVLGVMG
jgi:membrane associated rhomboid family serine protease